MMNREELLQHLAETLMEAHGFGQDTKETSPIEWDLDVKDSQISMLYEDAETLFDEYKSVSALSDLIGMTGSLGEYPETRWDGITQNVTVPEMKAVDTHVVIDHILGGTGSITFGELCEWKERAELLGANDDSVLAGYLRLTATMDNAFVELVEPGTENARYVIHPPSLNDI